MVDHQQMELISRHAENMAEILSCQVPSSQTNTESSSSGQGADLRSSWASDDPDMI